MTAKLIMPPSGICQRTVIADDRQEIGYAVSGDRVKQTVMLISGLGQDVTSWYRLLDCISQDFRVIIPEHRGVGLSKTVRISEGSLSIDRMAADIHHVIQKECPEGVDCIVGGSMGGFITQTLYARFPAAARSLVLASTSVGGGNSYNIPERTRAVWRLALEGDADAMQASFEASHSTSWLADNPLLAEEVKYLRFASRPSAAVWREQFHAVEDFLRRGSPVQKIDVPTEVMHGDLDGVIPFENVEVTMSRCNDSRLVIAENAGHAVWIERPELVAESIKSLVARENNLK